MEWPVMAILEYLTKIIVLVLSTVVIFFIRKYSLEKWVVKAVHAAEQLFPPGTGDKKLQWVTEFIKSNFKWITLSDKELRILIEAAVKELKKIQTRE